MKNTFGLLVMALLFVFSINSVWAKSDRANARKIAICHREGESGNFHLINVSENSKEAHLNHGDALPGDMVPDMEGKKLTIDCQVVDIWSYVETIEVPSSSTTPTLSQNLLESGKNYQLRSHGVWTNSQNLADTEYITKDNWATPEDGYDHSPYFLGEGAFDLLVNNSFVNWGSYSITHDYLFNIVGNDSKLSLLVFDGDSDLGPGAIVPGWYGDNTGSLFVDIFVQN